MDTGAEPGRSTEGAEELAKANKRIRELEEEVKILRKAASAVEEVVPPKGLYALVAELAAEGVGIERSCFFLGVSRSGYYEWRDRPPSARAIRHAWLTDLISTVHAASNGVYGRRRVHAELVHGHGVEVGKRAVHLLMGRAGLVGLPKRRGLKRAPGLIASDDLVGRRFARTGPNQLWVTDITEHPTREGKIYCCVVLDAWSRRVVGWSIDSSQTAQLATNALGMAIEQRERSPGGIIHADHGTQFTSWAFTERARRAGLLPSMGKVGSPYDNALVEAFWGRMQTELDAICQVKRVWQEQPERAEQTLERYGALVDRFARHAQIMGLSALAEVDPLIIKSWVNAPGRDRRGRVAVPSAKTVKQRRAAVAAFFETAMAQGLTFDDPTLLVPLPKAVATSAGIRPLDPDEAVDVRFRAGTNPAEVRGVVVSLLLSGARTGELGALERSHVEPGRAVRLRGSAHFAPRTISIDAETAGLLAARAAYLAERCPQVSLLCGKMGKPGSQQSRIGTVVRKVLKSAGLGDDPQVAPTSLTAYAARREFERTGSLEAAAQLIGSRSLDSTARLIGHFWIEASA